MKHFTPKKEDSFLISLFLFSCFSFQTRAELVPIKFYYNAVVRRFLKTFRKFAEKRLWWKPFLRKFKLFKMDSVKGVFLSVFRTPFYGCFQTLNRNAFLFNDIIVWCKYSTVIKDFSKSGSFSLLNAPIYKELDFFILSTRTLRIFWNVFFSKKFVELKSFLCKDKSSQNFLKSV